MDIIELGMPFSDPMADGPAIQKAALRALKMAKPRPKRWAWCASSVNKTARLPSC